jgi:hypothetical protein
VLRNDEEQMTIRCWAWDVQNNIKVATDDSFAKLIFRKSEGWIEPDERDLRELVNRRAAIGMRNCILQIVPKSLCEDALAVCKKTLAGGLKDPDDAKKRIIMAYQKYGVDVSTLQDYLEKESSRWGIDELLELDGILKELDEKNAVVNDYFKPKGVEVPQEKEANLGAMEKGDEKTHQGYEGAQAAPRARPQPAPAPRNDKANVMTGEQFTELDGLMTERAAALRHRRYKAVKANAVAILGGFSGLIKPSAEAAARMIEFMQSVPLKAEE